MNSTTSTTTTIQITFFIFFYRFLSEFPNLPTGTGTTAAEAAAAPTKSAASASAGFADVAAGSYCAAAVDWAYEAGITSGASSTGFAPNSALTREQAALALERLGLLE